MKKSELRNIIKEEIKAHREGLKESVNEGKIEPLFKKGDSVKVKTVYGGVKKYSGKDGVIASDPMEHSNSKFSYMVKINRNEIEFDENELNKI
jgi:hypothetical protein